MVWGGTSLEGHTDLHVTANGSLTPVRYRDETLRAIVRPYAVAVCPGFLLVHNNARNHVARMWQQFLDDEGIDAIDRPSRSPDPNTIEHLRDVMYRCIQVPPQTVQEFSDALIPRLPSADSSGDQPVISMFYFLVWILIQASIGGWFLFPSVFTSFRSQQIILCTSVKIFNLNNLCIKIWCVI